VAALARAITACLDPAVAQAAATANPPLMARLEAVTVGAAYLGAVGTVT
jgi:hypothetical protein